MAVHMGHRTKGKPLALKQLMRNTARERLRPRKKRRRHRHIHNGKGIHPRWVLGSLYRPSRSLE